MNKVLVLLGFILLANVGFSQYNSEGELTSRFRAGFMWFYTGLRPAKVDKVRKYDRLIFDITYNDWNGDQELFQNHWASIGLNTNLMFDIPLATFCMSVRLVFTFPIGVSWAATVVSVLIAFARATRSTMFGATVSAVVVILPLMSASASRF